MFLKILSFNIFDVYGILISICRFKFCAFSRYLSSKHQTYKMLLLWLKRLLSSVATKIENGPKTKTKNLWIWKIDQRRIRRIFINLKILWRSSKIANSSNIFEDTKIFKGKWKIFVVKNFLSGSNLNNFSQQ